MGPRKSGFTLIELLVVIAIIAVLAAILFPVFMSAKESAKTRSCLNNMVQLSRGFRMYVDDWGRFPGGAPLGEPSTWGQWVYNHGAWPNNVQIVSKGGLWPYIRNERVYVCPSDGGQMRMINGRAAIL